MSKEQSTTSRLRGRSGNILIFTGLLTAMSSVALIIGYSFAGVYFIKNRLQSTADAIALAGAQKLNDKDRIGQMNCMIARCRHLVFTTRQDYEKAFDAGRPQDPSLQRLASQLMDEARRSATELNAEQRSLLALSKMEAEEAMTSKFEGWKKSYAVALPWLVVEIPTMQEKSFGKARELRSNVEEMAGLTELAKHDREKNRVQEGKLSLYREEIDAQLPGVDSDLRFPISPLPAPVDNEVPQARVALVRAFEQIKPGFQPCATRVTLSLSVSTGLGAAAGGELKASAAAVATGGGIQP